MRGHFAVACKNVEVVSFVDAECERRCRGRYGKDE
jgi:hypothetical protein